MSLKSPEVFVEMCFQGTPTQESQFRKACKLANGQALQNLAKETVNSVKKKILSNCSPDSFFLQMIWQDIVTYKK